jgi:hypothetical protein
MWPFGHPVEGPFYCPSMEMEPGKKGKVFPSGPARPSKPSGNSEEYSIRTVACKVQYFPAWNGPEPDA